LPLTIDQAQAQPEKTVSLYGYSVSTTFDFSIDLPPSPSPAEIQFHKATSTKEMESGKKVRSYDEELPLGTLVVRRDNEIDILSFKDVVDYYLSQSSVEFHLRDHRFEHFIETAFLATVMPFWLERSGRPVLHASAVATERGAIAFLGSGDQGKSSIAATLMQLGCALVTDDALSVAFELGSFTAIPSYPGMRMWPDTANFFLGHSESLPMAYPGVDKRQVKVGTGGFGSFTTRRHELRMIYLLDKATDAPPTDNVIIQDIAVSDSLIELIRLSKLPFTVDSAGLQPQRLAFFSKMVRAVPMHRLILPRRYDLLQRAAKTILIDSEIG
jgi:hypothetical protein